MAEFKRDEEREERIDMEIVVDIYKGLSTSDNWSREWGIGSRKE